MSYLDNFFLWRKKKKESHRTEYVTMTKEQLKERKEEEFNQYKKLREVIVDTAKSYIGQEEIRGNMGFKNAWFQKKMVAVGFRKTQPWCAYFAELVYKESYKKAGLNMFKKLDKLFSASVIKTMYNFEKAGYRLKTIPEPGDLIIWQSGRSSRGHIGVVIEKSKDNKWLVTVEGNTNKAVGREGIMVAKKTRRNIIRFKRKGLHIRGYISPIKK